MGYVSSSFQLRTRGDIMKGCCYCAGKNSEHVFCADDPSRPRSIEPNHKYLKRLDYPLILIIYVENFTRAQKKKKYFCRSYEELLFFLKLGIKLPWGCRSQLLRPDDFDVKPLKVTGLFQFMVEAQKIICDERENYHRQPIANRDPVFSQKILDLEKTLREVENAL